MSSDAAFATLLYSNSNGTYFFKALKNVNRNAMGTIDYERVQGVEGIILANIVTNTEAFSRASLADKRLESRISFKNGAEWQFLNPPEKDLDGNKFECMNSGASVRDRSCYF